MALSKVEIGNMALGEVPAPFMTSLEDTTQEAIQVRNAYQPSLDLLLDAHDWDFAIKRETLAVVDNTRGDEWTYSYQLPADLISPRRIMPIPGEQAGNSTVVAGLQTVAYPSVFLGSGGFQLDESVNLYPHAIAGGLLYTNLGDAMLEYTTNAVSEGSFTPLFARALSIEIASRIVFPLRQDTKRQDYLTGKAEVARERAIADDMNRQPRETYGFVSTDTVTRSWGP